VNPELSKGARIASWILSLLAAAILVQTLFFKFTGAEESKWIFSQLGVEPWGRIAAGVAELVAAGLLLVPRTRVFGALMSVGIMVGAIGSHLTVLGISVQNDGGLLFGLALVVLSASSVTAWLHRADALALARRFGA
jgi:uncharacterized membrane protein YphA (DoxX/SURF4 family)